MDKGLAEQIVKLTASGRSKDDKWDPKLDQDIDQGLYEKYSRELYGILCELTTGEPKNSVRGIVEGGFRHYQCFQQGGFITICLPGRCSEPT